MYIVRKGIEYFFPKIDEKVWKVVEKIDGKSENPKLTFYTYERI